MKENLREPSASACDEYQSDCFVCTTLMEMLESGLIKREESIYSLDEDPRTAKEKMRDIPANGFPVLLTSDDELEPLPLTPSPIIPPTPEHPAPEYASPEHPGLEHAVVDRLCLMSPLVVHAWATSPSLKVRESTVKCSDYRRAVSDPSSSM